MDKPGGEGASKHQMIDCYIHTLAKVLGSEEEAKKKIYNVSCERYFRFGCEIDEDTSNKLEGIPSVLFVLPDSYVDPEHKDYGGNSGHIIHILQPFWFFSHDCLKNAMFLLIRYAIYGIELDYCVLWDYDCLNRQSF